MENPTEFIFVYSGASRTTLPLNPEGIDAILFNAPAVLESRSTLKTTRDLVHESGAKKVFLDSGGFTQFQIEQAHLRNLDGKEDKRSTKRNEELSKVKLLYDSHKPIKGDGFFNLTAHHVYRACSEIQPDVTICPDLPVPPESDPGAQEFEWMKRYTYNLWSAREMLRLRRDLKVDTRIYLPIQCYNTRQLDTFLRELDWKELDGFSVPNRLLKQIHIAPRFFLELYKMGVKNVHVLGASNFEKIAVSAYFARNCFKLTSLDARSIVLFAFQGQYMKPYDLRTIDIHRDAITADDDAVFGTCTCGLCSKTTIMGLKEDLAPEERIRFLAHHNFNCTVEAMKAFFENAQSADMLVDFMVEQTKSHGKIAKSKPYRDGLERRYREIEQIYDVLGKVEFLKRKIDEGDCLD